MKLLLSSLISQLKELTLITLNSDVDLVDGNAWKDFLCTFTELNRFNFRFSFAFEGKLNVRSEKIESFKSNNWLIEKQCYVTVTPNSVFTVPYFSSDTVKYLDSNSPFDYIWTNSPSEDILNQNTKNIQFDIEILEKSQKEKHVYYPYVENIDWNQVPIKEKKINNLSLIRTTLDLSRIISFKGFPSQNATIFMDYIRLLPRLEEIHFRYTPKLFRKLRLLKQIRRLEICFEETEENNFNKEIDDLCRVFSNVEYLYLMKRLENELIIYLIEQLNSLSSLAILCQLDDQILIDIQQLNIEQTFISLTSLYSNINQKKIIAFWIDHSQRHLIKQINYQRKLKTKTKHKCILF